MVLTLFSKKSNSPAPRTPRGIVHPQLRTPTDGAGSPPIDVCNFIAEKSKPSAPQKNREERAAASVNRVRAVPPGKFDRCDHHFDIYLSNNLYNESQLNAVSHSNAGVKHRDDLHWLQLLSSFLLRALLAARGDSDGNLHKLV